MTDVISFALEEDEPDIIGLDIPRVLGDIIICTDVAKEQAESYNHSFERELGFLALHGFLHLLGYDHMNEEDEKETTTTAKMYQLHRDIVDKKWQRAIEGVSKQETTLYSLLAQLLNPNIKERITINQVLVHPWITDSYKWTCT